MPAGKQKEITVIKKMVTDAGYKVVPSGSGHWKVLYGNDSPKKGQAVVDENGPLILSGTSSEQRSRDMTIKRLMGAGVLKRNPWAPQKPGEGTEDEADAPDAAEVARRERDAEALRSRDQERTARTHKVRERLEPIITRIGGWDRRGNLTEVGLVAHYVASRLKIENVWVDAQSASENADALRKGATLSPTIAPMWEALLEELESWPDTRVRWMQLVGEAKGLSDPSIGLDLDEFVPTRSSGHLAIPPVVDGGSPNGNGDGNIPMLALRAMFEMGVGRPAQDPDRRHIIELGAEIARLEMSARQTEEGG